jgi:A/G-specific adenine glycosylase
LNLNNKIDRELQYKISSKKELLVQRLLDWSRKQSHNFSWRNTDSPYHVLLAEIFLRKTKADQVRKMYDSFLFTFPTLESIYNASESEIQKQIYSLGLENVRSRWIKKICGDLYNKYGNDLSEKNLESILGKEKRYLLNALKCFVFGHKVALFDVNIKRIIERIFGINLGIDAHRKEASWNIAFLLVPDKDWKQYNWAMLDLGRTICTATKPKCNICPLKQICKYSMDHSQ